MQTLSREAAQEFLYKSPVADRMIGMYKELTGVIDIPVSGRSYPEIGSTVVHTTHPLVLRDGNCSQRYDVMLLSNGETTELLVVDPLRGEPSSDSMQTAQLVAGLEAGSFTTGGYWVRLNKFAGQTPQRALEPKIHDYLLTRADRAFRRQGETSAHVYFLK